jgi:hypothetical protein
VKTLLKRYRAWRGPQLKLRAELAWLANEALDQLPAWQEGSWHRHGQWGCRLGLHRYWQQDRFLIR